MKICFGILLVPTKLFSICSFNLILGFITRFIFLTFDLMMDLFCWFYSCSSFVCHTLSKPRRSWLPTTSCISLLLRNFVPFYYPSLSLFCYLFPKSQQVYSPYNPTIFPYFSCLQYALWVLNSPSYLSLWCIQFQLFLFFYSIMQTISKCTDFYFPR